MLLEFKIKNFKSFADEVSFSMVPAPKQNDLAYSILKHKMNNKIYKSLCSSVIYGPNASGKTNIISAMEVLKSIIIKGNIRNSEGGISPNVALYRLELIPNNKLKSSKPQPVEFNISFIEENLLIDYSLKIDLGNFLDRDYKRKIIFEELKVNKKTIFIRDDKLKINNLNVLDEYIFNKNVNDNNLLIIAKGSLSDDELFMTNGFKLTFSKDFAQLFTDWFSNKFLIVYRADALQVRKNFNNPQSNTIYVEEAISNAIKMFGVDSNKIGYVPNNDGKDPTLSSLIKLSDKSKAAIPVELFESYGTIRFINIFPLIVQALQTGSTLVVDEFDASIHPSALISIINIFHDDEINVKKAQLVFNTHNPLFLNSNLFRRDEIKFVSRDEESESSDLYRLSDFKTSGINGVRKGSDYMNNYLFDKYGAIRDIDFSSIIEDLIKTGNV